MISFLSVFLNIIESLNGASNRHSNIGAENETQENNDCTEKVDVSIVSNTLLEVPLAKKRP